MMRSRRRAVPGFLALVLVLAAGAACDDSGSGALTTGPDPFNPPGNPPDDPSPPPVTGDALVFPLQPWVVQFPFGGYHPGRQGYHLADDAYAEPGATVFATYAGTVRLTSVNNEAVGYGGLVLIEHQLETERVVSLYGHLSTRRGLRVREGDLVERGDVIGTIADDDEDGGHSSRSHLHFGIRKGTFSLDDTVCGVWLYVGYTRSCEATSHESQMAMWYPPTEFIQRSQGP